MGRLLAFILGGLPISPAAMRAVAATFADWRHETQRAPHVIARLVVALRSTLALVRVLVGSAIWDLRAEVRSPFLWRVAAGSVAMVVALGFIEPMYPTATNGVGVFTLMGLAQGLFLGGMFLPLVVFAAEVTGKSTRRAPSLGSALAVAIAVLFWVWIVAPETINFMWTVHLWGPSTEVIPPASSVIRWFTGEPTREMSPLLVFNRGIAWVAFSTGFWSLAVLAYRLRRFAAGSTGRRIVIVWGSVLLGSVVIPAVTILPRLTPLARVPYAWTLLIAVFAVGAFAAAALIARWTASAEAEASASTP